MDEFLDDESKNKNSKKESSQDQNQEPSQDQNQEVKDFYEHDDKNSFSNRVISEIEYIKKLMFDEKYEEAHEKYMEVKEGFIELRKKHIEEQNKIYSALELINKQMVDSLNNSRRDVENKVVIMEQLIVKIKDHISKNELDIANKSFNQISELFDKLPNLLPHKKLKIENEISNLHISLNQKNAIINNALLQQKINNINQLLNVANVSIQNGKIDITIDLYKEINLIYSELPKGYVYEKAVLYQKILFLFKNIHQTQDKTSNLIANQNPVDNVNIADLNTDVNKIKEDKPKKKGFFK